MALKDTNDPFIKAFFEPSTWWMTGIMCVALILINIGLYISLDFASKISELISNWHKLNTLIPIWIKLAATFLMIIAAVYGLKRVFKFNNLILIALVILVCLISLFFEFKIINTTRLGAFSLSCIFVFLAQVAISSHKYFISRKLTHDIL